MVTDPEHGRRYVRYVREAIGSVGTHICGVFARTHLVDHRIRGSSRDNDSSLT